MFNRIKVKGGGERIREHTKVRVKQEGGKRRGKRGKEEGGRGGRKKREENREGVRERGIIAGIWRKH